MVSANQRELGVLRSEHAGIEKLLKVITLMCPTIFFYHINLISH